MRVTAREVGISGQVCVVVERVGLCPATALHPGALGLRDEWLPHFPHSGLQSVGRWSVNTERQPDLGLVFIRDGGEGIRRVAGSGCRHHFSLLDSKWVGYERRKGKIT